VLILLWTEHEVQVTETPGIIKTKSTVP